ncbi:putative rnase h domain protein [Erysiphe necator]|uniref:ribonuclease H n=1 Tax=Uncinula necator TaxID=52586 RepID=A0A0B1PFG5_UNCNE|nr:putative rnase h domain protein [Erysiphe necator]
MEVIPEIQCYNPQQALAYERNQTPIGAFLKFTDGTFPDYPRIRKGLKINAIKANSFHKGSTGLTTSLCSENQGSYLKKFRASTGTLPSVNKDLSQALGPGHRASTGGLKINNSPTSRNSYQHILAKNLTSPTEFVEPRTRPEINSHCNRCGQIIRFQYFKCVNCPSFRLCAQCGDGGIYCQDDTHAWVEKIPKRNGNRSQVIGEISCGEARTLYYGTNTFPSIFRPPSLMETPGTLFSNDHRFIRKTNPREILLYADGACIRSSKGDSAAGWAFVYRPSAYTQDGNLTHAGTISGRLEVKGPTGKKYSPTSNRAELRAAIAALQFLDWSEDCNRGWRSVVIATDSEYVTCSVTKWIADWEDTNWKLEDKSTVNNEDLWKLLLKEVRKYHAEGVKIAFWRIPRHCNIRAYEFAKRATGRGYKERLETVIFKPDGPVKVRVIPFPKT